MSSVTTQQPQRVGTPRAARAAIVLALVLAFIFGISVRSGPIMLLGLSFTALYSAVSMLRRRAWGGYGFGFLLVLSTLALLFFAVTGQNSGGFLRVSIVTIIYLGIAALFFLSGHSLAVAGGKKGSPLPWFVIALCLSLPFLVGRPVTISSGSMAPTLLTGDFILANQFDRQPLRGKLIAFRYPLDGSQIFIRRIAGLPGDRIHFADGQMIRDGAVVAQPFRFDNFPAGVDLKALQSGGREMLQHNLENGEIVVPAHKLFVLGDAKDGAFDSRNWGFLDEADLVGTPKLIYDSLAPGTTSATQPSAESAPSHRWERVFKPL